MCSAFGSRTAPSRRKAFGQVASSVAEVCESPLANNVTSCPNATSSSVNQCTTRSVPPYSLGGTASVNGATCAMRIFPSPVCDHGYEKALSQHSAPACRDWNVPASAKFPLFSVSTFLLSQSGLADAMRGEQISLAVMLHDCCAVVA